MQEIISRIIEKIKKEYRPEKMILFGSYAWGNPTEESDLDLLIIKNTRASPMKRWIDVRSIVYDENLLIPFEPLIYTPKEVKKRLEIGDSFMRIIFQKGKVLYG